MVASVPSVLATCTAYEEFKECVAEKEETRSTNELQRVVKFHGGFEVDEYEGMKGHGCRSKSSNG